ncbi:MAG: hypothetical protein RBR75_02005, partial [Acholeplasmataceae bacterium]|nr:hypothetical protein [Acholeplasmataceae bacterium]
GKQFKLTAKPKYQATQMTVNTLEYTFIVNDGHNDYSNHELKTLFGDFNVETINIHANIQAELAANQKNADGSPINKRPTVSNPVTGNVYSRFSESIDNDSITIEGNYMTIDGSNLPYSNKNSGSGLVGFAQSFEVINVQIAIFSYSVRDANLVPAVNEPPTNNNQLNVNNLILKGNTSTPYVDFDGTVEQIELQERLMSKNSGGYIGFFVEHGRTDFNNMVIMNTVIAVTHNSYGLNTLNEPTYAYYDHVKVYNSWANSLYTHGGNGMIVTNSYIGQSGGSSIHMVDYRKFGTTSTPTSYPHNNPYLYLDSTTTIENWISGEEAWFKAYGMSQVALTLKSGIETGIQGTGRSIIQTVTNPVNGLEIEMLNFILLTESSSGAENYSNPPTNTILDSGSEVKLNINGVQVERPFNYLSSPTDPRVDTVNQRFVFPLGAVSNVADFVTYYTNIREQVATDADANNVASLGAFYGLAWNEALQVAGYMSAVPGSTPMQAINYNGYTPTFPEYLEILSVVPVFPNGFSSIIIQLNPLS